MTSSGSADESVTMFQLHWRSGRGRRSISDTVTSQENLSGEEVEQDRPVMEVQGCQIDAGSRENQYPTPSKQNGLKLEGKTFTLMINQLVV